MRYMYRRARISGLTGALLGITLLVGCSAQAAGEPAVPAPTVSPSPLSFDYPKPSFAFDMVGCLTALGWDVTVGPDNSVRSPGIAEDDHRAYGLDTSQCREETGHDRARGTHLSEAQLRELYAHQAWAAVCLQHAGYDVSESPTEAEFLAQFAESGRVWDPYVGLVATLPADEIGALFATCPWD